MLEDAQYKYVIADSKLGTIENEKKQEIEDLKEKVCRWGLSCDFMGTRSCDNLRNNSSGQVSHNKMEQAWSRFPLASFPEQISYLSSGVFMILWMSAVFPSDRVLNDEV